MAEDIVTGLDIGTHTLKILTLQKKQKSWEVLDYSQIPSAGLRKGVVVKPDELTKTLQRAISEIENNYKIKIKSVFVNIGGNHIYVTPSDGIISVSRADQRISKEEVERVLEAAKAINIPRNDEVLDVIPKEFIIDGQRGIKEPLDLVGVRLEAKVLLLCVFSPYFLNLTQAVLNAKLQINDVVPSPLAAAQAVLTPKQKELGVALIDIGANTTSLAVFEEGELLHLAIFPIGSANITNDIAIGLKIDIDTAEEIKKEYGTCFLTPGEREKGKKKIEIFDRALPVNFSRKELVEIIEPRVYEILDLIQKELKKIGRQQLLPAGVILTGGGAKLPRIKEFTRQTLKLACEIGRPSQFKDLPEGPALATVVGLAMNGIDFDEQDSILKTARGFFLKSAKFFKKIFRAFSL